MAEYVGVEMNRMHKASHIATTATLADFWRSAGILEDIKLRFAEAPCSPEIIPAGFVCSYAQLFEDCGLMFPIPQILLEMLAALQLTFTKMGPGFAHHIVGLMVRCGKTGDVMSADLALSMYSFMHNSTADVLGTFYVIPRKERCIVRELPPRDANWQERYFYFRISPVTVGDFDYGRWNSVFFGFNR